MAKMVTPAMFWSHLTGSKVEAAMRNSSDFGPTVAESLARLTLDSSRQPSSELSGSPDCASDSGLWLPDEILLEILQHLLPKKRAYTISTNGDDIDFCPATLTSLLQTSTKLKYEVLRITKEYPIHINITSGNGCPCRSLENAKAILETSLGKAARLPLWAWREVIVTFSPALYRKVADECKVPLNVEDSTRLRALTHATGLRDFAYRDLNHSIQCVLRQSYALGSVMREFARMEQKRRQTYFRFQFNGAMGVDDFEQAMPPASHSIWDLKALRGALSPWRWTSSRDRAIPPMVLPRCLDVGVDLAPNGYFKQGQELPSAIHERFYHEMIAWWNYQRPLHGRYIWNHDEVDRGFEETFDDALFYMGPLRVGLWPITLRGLEM